MAYHLGIDSYRSHYSKATFNDFGWIAVLLFERYFHSRFECITQFQDHLEYYVLTLIMSLARRFPFDSRVFLSLFGEVAFDSEDVDPPPPWTNLVDAVEEEGSRPS